MQKFHKSTIKFVQIAYASYLFPVNSYDRFVEEQIDLSYYL